VVRPNEIAARFKAGRDRVRKALNQLVECGYIEKAQTRDTATGRLGAVEYVVRALPEGERDAPVEVMIAASPLIAPEASIAPAPEIPSTVPPRSPESPSTEIPSTEIRSLLSTELLPRTDSTKEVNTLSLSLAGVRLTDAEIDAEFMDRFWPAYPKQEGEHPARMAFRTAVRKGIATADQIIAGAERLAEHWERREDQRFIPMPAKWLRERRWNDRLARRQPETIFDICDQFRERVSERWSS